MNQNNKSLIWKRSDLNSAYNWGCFPGIIELFVCFIVDQGCLSDGRSRSVNMINYLHLRNTPRYISGFFPPLSFLLPLITSVFCTRLQRLIWNGKMTTLLNNDLSFMGRSKGWLSIKMSSIIVTETVIKKALRDLGE